MNPAEKREKLRAKMAELTNPINGQYPRPWMAYGNPAEAEVFVVGMNQAKTYKVEEVGNHQQFLDAHFNCEGPGQCRALYDKVTGGKSSPTRENIDRLRARLEREGVTKVLETNVICYATSMSADLRRREHLGGVARGREIFHAALNGVCPKLLIVHGVGATKKLGRTLGVCLPSPVCESEEFELFRESILADWGESLDILVIPSLAPPKWNMWCSQENTAFPIIAQTVDEILRQSGTISL